MGKKIMLFTLEISRPIQWRPRVNHSPHVGVSFMFLFFALYIIPMRLDEYNLLLMKTGQRVDAPDWEKWLQEGVEQKKRTAAHRESTR